jgi:hypothetical protein
MVKIIESKIMSTLHMAIAIVWTNKVMPKN